MVHLLNSIFPVHHINTTLIAVLTHHKTHYIWTQHKQNKTYQIHLSLSFHFSSKHQLSNFVKIWLHVLFSSAAYTLTLNWEEAYRHSLL